MSDSERLQRYRQKCGSCEYTNAADREDEELSGRILALLNHPKLDKFCMLDAYYYDFSVLPKNVKGKFWQDMYLIFGITEDGDFVAKWIERYDLDSKKPVENGEIAKE